MRKILKRIALIAGGFILQSIIGSGSNWFLGPMVFATQSTWEAFIILFFVNVGKNVFTIYVYDSFAGVLSSKKNRKNNSKKMNYRRTKMLLRYGYFFLGVVAIVGNNFYGILLVRRKHKGIPKGIWRTVFWGLIASTCLLMLALSGIFSFGALVSALLEKYGDIIWFLLPHIIFP